MGVSGTFNDQGQFLAPDGDVLIRVKSSISPSKAASLVATGALVAFEDCGCGGYAGGCIPEWVSTERLAAAGKPKFVKGYGSPTWIDIWKSDSSTVVFLHGDVKWGDEL